MKPVKKAPAVLLTDDLALEGDHGKRSRATRTCAERLAHRLGVSIDLIHVEDLYLYPVKTPAYKPLLERWFVGRKAELSRISESLSVPTRGLFVHGDPVKKVLALAAKRGVYETVVVGTHGRRGVGRALLGSVAEEIIRNATIPVFAVGPEAQEHAHDFLKQEEPVLLFATELSSNSEKAEAYALSLAKRLGASVILFHSMHDALHPVLQSAFGAPGLAVPIQDFFQELRAQSLKTLRAKAKTFEQAGVAATAVLNDTTISAADAVLSQAGTASASLIVMGTHGRTLLAGAFFGRTVRDVILKAKQPVITVRSKKT